MAGTDQTQTIEVGPTPVVVLVNPQLGENIGMAARAMANFGLHELRLVDPREGWDRERAVNAAAGAFATVEQAQVFADLRSALIDARYVYATTARPRDMVKTVITPEQAGTDMRARSAAGDKCAMLFGRERFGLNNDEVSLADVVVTAPVNPDYASLNIAQAVLLMSYEWFRHAATSLGMATPELAAIAGPGLQIGDTRLAKKNELYGFYDHLEAELGMAGFFKTDKLQPTMMRNLRNLFARAQMTEQEVRSMRGVVSSLTRKHLRSREPKA